MPVKGGDQRNKTTEGKVHMANRLVGLMQHMAENQIHRFTAIEQLFALFAGQPFDQAAKDLQRCFNRHSLVPSTACQRMARQRCLTLSPLQSALASGHALCATALRPSH